MGLYHTFQGGCAEDERRRGRHARREVAGLRLPGGPRHLHRPEPGVDPITNFMDYTDDACMNQFDGRPGHAHGPAVHHLPLRASRPTTDRQMSAGPGGRAGPRRLSGDHGRSAICDARTLRCPFSWLSSARGGFRRPSSRPRAGSRPPAFVTCDRRPPRPRFTGQRRVPASGTATPRPCGWRRDESTSERFTLESDPRCRRDRVVLPRRRPLHRRRLGGSSPRRPPARGSPGHGLGLRGRAQPQGGLGAVTTAGQRGGCWRSFMPDSAMSRR